MHFPNNSKSKYEIKEKEISGNGFPIIEQPAPSRMESRGWKIMISVVIVFLLIAAITPTVVLATQDKKDQGKPEPGDCETVPDGLNECGLAGWWRNQLNSEMNILTCMSGQVTGKYKTIVGKASNFYDLVGRYTRVGNNSADTILGWSVSWKNEYYGNSNSTTSWTGIYYHQEKIIHTHWILVRYHTRPNLWKTNMIGHDEFKRICP